MGSGGGSIPPAAIFETFPRLWELAAKGELRIDAMPVPLTDVAEAWQAPPECVDLGAQTGCRWPLINSGDPEGRRQEITAVARSTTPHPAPATALMASDEDRATGTAASPAMVTRAAVR